MAPRRPAPIRALRRAALEAELLGALVGAWVRVRRGAVTLGSARDRVSAPCDEEALRARYIGWLAERRAAGLRLTSPCLPAALAARTLLARRGIASHVVIGAGPEAARRGYHAWLMVGEECVCGAAERAGLVPLVGD